MNAFLDVVSMTSDYFATVFLLFVLYMLYPAKRFIKHPWVVFEIFGAVSVLVQFVTGLMQLNSFYVNSLLFPIGGLIYVLFFLDDNPFSMSAVVLLFFAAQLQMTVACSNLAGFFFPEVFWLSIISSRVLPRIGLVLLYFFVKKFRVPGKERIPISYWMSIVFTSLTSSVCLTLFLPGRVQGESIEILLVVMASSFFITNLFTYYLFYRVTKEYREKLSSQALEHRIAMNQQHMEEVNTLYQNLRAIRHDLLNHITIMDGMIRQRNYRELDRYFQALRRDNSSIEQFVDCGYVSVNALINPKLSYAKELGIRMSIRAALSPDVQIEETDICALLANLLDNAIEACSHLENPFLELDMHPERSYLSVIVRNTVDSDVLKDNPRLHTTKQDKRIHGIGLSIVHSIVNKYDGIEDFSVEDDMFVVKILLEDKKPDNL